MALKKVAAFSFLEAGRTMVRKEREKDYEKLINCLKSIWMLKKYELENTKLSKDEKTKLKEIDPKMKYLILVQNHIISKEYHREKRELRKRLKKQRKQYDNNMYDNNVSHINFNLSDAFMKKIKESM